MDTTTKKRSSLKQLWIVMVSFLFAIIGMKVVAFLGFLISGLLGSLSEALPLIIMSLFFIMAIIAAVIVYIKMRRYLDETLD